MLTFLRLKNPSLGKPKEQQQEEENVLGQTSSENHFADPIFWYIHQGAMASCSLLLNTWFMVNLGAQSRQVSSDLRREMIEEIQG